jgi:O-antigen ligase
MNLAALVAFLAIFTGLLAYGAGIFVWTVMLAAALGAAVLLVAALRRPAPPAGRLRWLRLAYLAALLFTVCGLLPLPGRVSFITGSKRYVQNEKVLAIAERASAADGLPARQLWFASTRNRAGSARTLLCLALAFVGAGLTSRLGPTQRRALVPFLLLAGTVTAVLGVIGQWWIPQGDTLWHSIPVPHGRPGPVGGFINPNHFAGFAALFLPLALTTAIESLGRRRRWHALAAAAALLLMFGAVVASLSRGGLVAAVAGLLATALWTARRQRRLLAAALPALLAAALVGLLVSALLPTVRTRLLTLGAPFQTASFHERADAWQGALRIWRDYPLVGGGMNAFRVVYPQYRHTTERDYRTFAENEYIQLLADAGLAGLALLAMLVTGLLLALRRGDPETDSLMPAAVAGALAVVATHALVEFVLHLPLYAFTVAALVTCHPSLAPATRTPPPPGPRPSLCGACLPALTLAAILALAPWHAPIQRFDSLGFASAADAAALVHALSWAPTSPHLWVRLGERFADADNPATRRLGDRAATIGLEYDPHNCMLWVRLGHLRLRLGDRRGAKAAFDRASELRSWIKVPKIEE